MQMPGEETEIIQKDNLEVLHVVNKHTQTSVPAQWSQLLNELQAGVHSRVIDLKHYLKTRRKLVLNSREQTQVVHLHHPKSASVFLLFNSFRRSRRKKCVLTIHNDVGSFRFLNRLLLQACMVFADAVVFNSSQTKDSAERQFSAVYKHIVKKGNSKIISNPVRTQGQVAKRNLEEDPTRYDVIFVGRFVEQKNLVRLVEALGLVSRERALRCIFVGDGIQRDQIENLSIEHGLDAEFTGLLSHDEVLDLLPFAKVFASPSLWEGYGNTFDEAWAAGLVLVGSNIPVLDRFPSNRFFAAAPKDVDDLASKLRAALDVSNNSSADVNNELFGQQTQDNLNAYLELYQHVASSS